MHVRTRIAPSPTGALHIGTARTTLFNYLFAKREGGEFLLRIEDTDLERSDKKFEKDIIEGLKWLGIDWDGEITRQSDRLDIYEKYLNKLLESGSAFYCMHSEEELDAERNKQIADKNSPKHICDAREKNFKKGIIRFKNIATSPIIFLDEIRGEISFDPKLMGDFSLAKNTRAPLYNFAVVVDDYEMQISHVIRGEDHISNTPKQILLQNSLMFSKLKYAHLPLILGPDRSKLSKRHGATSVMEYREDGYLPEALFNFMALLGWRPTLSTGGPEGAGEGSEIFSKEELVKMFSLGKIQKAGAIFDLTKLDWMNGEYIRKKSPTELLKHLSDIKLPFGRPTSKLEYLEKIIALEQPRLKKLSEFPEKTDYFFKEPKYEVDLLKWKEMNSDEIKKSLETSMELSGKFHEKDFDKKNLEKTFLEKARDFVNRGELLWPLRIALSGKTASPGPFEIMEILGKEKTQIRIERAINMLK